MPQVPCTHETPEGCPYCDVIGYIKNQNTNNEALYANCLHYLEFAYFSPILDAVKFTPQGGRIELQLGLEQMDAEVADVFWDYCRKDVIDLIKVLSAVSLVQKVTIPLELRRKCVSYNNGEALGGSYKMTEQGRQLLEDYRKRVGYAHE